MWRLMRGDAEHVDPAGSVLHDGEAVQPCQRDGLGMKEVNRQDADGRCCEELLPARAGSPRRRVNTGLLQDGPHGRWCDLVAQPGQFSGDAPVAPGGVFGRQPQNEPVDRRPGWRPPCRCRLRVQRCFTRSACQRSSVPGVTSMPNRRAFGRSPASAATTVRSAHDRRGRATCRRSTASWWRRTRISMSLDRLERPSRTNQPSSRTKIRYSNRRATKPDPVGQTSGASGQQQTPGHAPQPSSRQLHGLAATAAPSSGGRAGRA